MATRHLTFHDDFCRVQVVCNGVPLSLNAEVDLTLRRPVKLDRASKVAWDQLTQASSQYASVELVSKGDGGSEQ